MDVREAISASKAGPATRTSERLPDVLEFYLQYHYIEGSTPDTIKFYRKEVRQFILWLGEQGHSLLAGEVTALHILGHLESLKRRDLAPRSVRTRLQAIKTMFKWAMNWEIVPQNPAERIKPPKVPKVRKPFLKPDAFDKLLDLCPLTTMVGARRQAMMWLLATTGVRHRELTLLQLEDLDWKRGQLRVLRRLVEKAGLKGQVKDVCHIFRRTFAANAVRQGIPRPHIQGVAGWSTPHMLDHYIAAMEAEDGAIEAFREFKPFGG